MKIEKIYCSNCGTEVITYHDEGYKGKRARCPICKADFPME